MTFPKIPNCGICLRPMDMHVVGGACPTDMRPPKSMVNDAVSPRPDPPPAPPRKAYRRTFEEAQAVTLDAFAIVDALAECSAFDHRGWCIFCSAAAEMQKETHHDADCLWLRATINKSERAR